MTGNVSARRRRLVARVAGMVVLSLVALGAPVGGAAQAPGGSVAGRVADERGGPVAGADVAIAASALGARTATNGTYVIENVPAGTHTVRARLIGYRSQTASVTVATGRRTTQDFTLAADPLNLEAVVVTGTETPRTKLETSNAVTVLSAADITRAAPRSTTEMLRYIPGFTRVESSGGEVNQNYTMRGILGIEYVMFMEDGLPVFPTMHTFWMNADNLFRPDENIERMEVVRGGSSALFGSSTPGAIVNFINKTGGSDVGGSLKVSGATQGLARYDFNLNGPFGQDWRFNFGGFYRYDHGVRDPGFPGIRGGQLKASVTRQLEKGYLRASLKYIDDRNQFILPLPFQDPDNPAYVPGFSNYGSLNTVEGNHVRVPIPTGELELPLDDGLRTRAYWLTAEASFDIGNGWNLQNSAQVMENAQDFNAIFPSDIMPAADFVTRPTGEGGLGYPVGTPFQYVYTNHFDVTGTNRLPFNTPNGLVTPGEEIHVEKPISAFQNQIQLKKSVGQHSLSAGVYFANYTQTNRWFGTQILMDVRDNPRFLDLTVTPAAQPTRFVTRNGFRNFLSLYRNADGQTTVFSPVVGGSVKVSDRVRVDAGFRYEWNIFSQSSENVCAAYATQRTTANPTACLDSAFARAFDLDGDSSTTYDNESFGLGSFRHFDLTIGDWAASLGLNYALTSQTSLYAQGSRGFKMPALDEFIDATAQQQVEEFGARENWTAEVGVKHASRRFGVTVNGFYTLLKNIVSQGLETIGGQQVWVTRSSPENRAFGLEAEGSATLATGLSFLGSATVLKADFPSCPTPTGTQLPCPAGADAGTVLNGVPPLVGNVSATYTTTSGISFLADWHYVHRRYSTFADTAGNRNRLPTYSYANLGASYTLPNQSVTFSADLLNAYQSKGLEEGNPRLTSVGGLTSNRFLARPILPRRFTASVRYQF
jgi:outer membrane receptor protein involved in Fe transport